MLFGTSNPVYSQNIEKGWQSQHYLDASAVSAYVSTSGEQDALVRPVLRCSWSCNGLKTRDRCEYYANGEREDFGRLPARISDLSTASCGMRMRVAASGAEVPSSRSSSRYTNSRNVRQELRRSRADAKCTAPSHAQHPAL